MSQRELLRHVADSLEAAQIPYVLTGSMASSLQGHPRATHGIDLVVALVPSSVPALLQMFPSPRFYIDEDSVRAAIADGFMFNVLDTQTGDKIDFWMLKDDPFDQSMFARRYREAAVGTFLMVPRAEDTILSKLRWAQMSGGSERQMADCRAVYETNREVLDLAYMDQWASTLGVSDLLAQIRRETRA